jgi:hypothetical protein
MLYVNISTETESVRDKPVPTYYCHIKPLLIVPNLFKIWEVTWIKYKVHTTCTVSYVMDFT